MVEDEDEVVDEVVPEWVAVMSDPAVEAAASLETEAEDTAAVVVDTVVEEVDSEATAVDSTLAVLPSHPLLLEVLLGGRWRRRRPTSMMNPDTLPIPLDIFPPDSISIP